MNDEPNDPEVLRQAAPLMVAVPWSRWQAHTAAMAALGRSVERARRAHPSSSGPAS